MVSMRCFLNRGGQSPSLLLRMIGTRDSKWGSTTAATSGRTRRFPVKRQARNTRPKKIIIESIKNPAVRGPFPSMKRQDTEKCRFYENQERLTLLTIIPPKLCATKITGRLVVCHSGPSKSCPDVRLSHGQ